jgi:predicted NBD/HSP70 family sugar kinase
MVLVGMESKKMPDILSALTSPPGRSIDPSRGTNQSGVKLYNERLILSLIRSHGSLSKTEIARRTGLSNQTSSVIMKQLESEGLLIKGTPIRGKVGQPSVPMSLNPEGAFSIGFKFGRRSADLVLMDFVGRVRQVLRENYAYPTPNELERFVRSGVAELTQGLDEQQTKRICGFGIAAPFEMWGWEDEVGAPHEVQEAWRTYEIKSEVEGLVPWPVHFCNDATAACAAELAFGNRTRYSNFLYIFFATLIGGGVVLNGSLYPGRAGYAGAFGSVLVPGLTDAVSAGAKSLIRCASIYILENMLKNEGQDPSILWRHPNDWSAVGTTLDTWIEQASTSVSVAIGSAISIIDFEAIVIDGAFPQAIRSAVVQRIREKFAQMDLHGLAPVDIVEGAIGSDARVLGAASLPLLAGFARDRDLLFNAAV